MKSVIKDLKWAHNLKIKDSPPQRIPNVSPATPTAMTWLYLLALVCLKNIVVDLHKRLSTLCYELY